ncbi:MAG: NUDIX hydrolase [Clostridiales bacterium]|nr:NUDIX hydrolase [Clostridiales bacterium]
MCRETVYEGKIVNLRSDRVRLKNGKVVPREVVEHPGGVVIAAVTDSGGIMAVRQYRYCVSEELLELPAGKLERGEYPLDCAKRELSEETGCTAENWVDLGKIYPSPGFCEEILYIFLATGLRHGEAHPDEDEFLSVCEVSFDAFWEMIMSNSLPDAKTIAGVVKAERYLKNLEVS